MTARSPGKRLSILLQRDDHPIIVNDEVGRSYQITAYYPGDGLISARHCADLGSNKNKSPIKIGDLITISNEEIAFDVSVINFDFSGIEFKISRKLRLD
ncbi:MAG: hypothetical protein AB7P49_11435 [Bdellovibrionales bacterium]